MAGKKAKKVVIILLVVSVLLALLFAGVYWYGCIMHTAGGVVKAAVDMDYVVSSYIRENQGKFPADEEDLIRQHFLRKTKSNNGYDYFIRSFYFDHENPDSEKGWNQIYFIDSLKISYGVRIEDIELVNGLLCKKNTDEWILLIDGPYGEKHSLRGFYYDPISIRWYALMLQEKQRAENAKETTEGTE